MYSASSSTGPRAFWRITPEPSIPSRQPLLCSKPNMTPHFMLGHACVCLLPCLLLLSPLLTLLQPHLSLRISLNIPFWLYHWCSSCLECPSPREPMIHSPSSKFWKKSHLGLRIHPGVLISNLSYDIRTPTPLNLLHCPSLKENHFYLLLPQIIYLVLLFTSASKAGTQKIVSVFQK